MRLPWVLPLALLLIAWVSVKITGGGLLIDSSNGQQVATLTLQCDNCTNDGYKAAGQFNFVDHQTGAHLQGQLGAYVQCTPNSDPTGHSYATDCLLFCDQTFLPGAHLIYAEDTSGAHLAVCIQDNGQGNTAPGQAVVVIPPSSTSQQFRRVKTIVNGNFMVH